MKKWLMAVVFGIILVLGACGGDDDGGSEEPADNGAETADASEAEGLFKENCASCHGDDLSGDNGPDLTEVGSRLSEDEIEETIEDGADGMPGGLVSGDDLTMLTEWLAGKK